MSAAEAVQVATAGGAHVFADARIDRRAAAIAALIDRGFSPRPGGTRHERCWRSPRSIRCWGDPFAGPRTVNAPAASRICGSCCRRLTEHGLSEHENRTADARSPAVRTRTGRLPCRGLRAGMGVGAVGIVLGSC